MLYYFFKYLTQYESGFNVFRYITFRSTAAFIFAFFMGLLVAPVVIRWFKRANLTEDVSKKDAADIAESHARKMGTPTMGGLIILTGSISATLLWARPHFYVLMGVLVLAVLGTLGFIDDYIKLTNPKSSGLKKRYKMIVQCILAVVLGVIIFNFTSREIVNVGTNDTYSADFITASAPSDESVIEERVLADGSQYYRVQYGDWLHRLTLPFFSKVHIPLSLPVYILVMLAVIVGSSNAVNLTDGLDGLAASCVIIVALTLTIVAYVVGRVDFSSYLKITYVPWAGELAIYGMAIAGAVMAFLWYNSYPAEIFMGDVGSLPLGGALGYLALVCRQELMLAIVGGIFVIEALSVVLQVGSYRLRGGKRIFRRAPIHHHFEMKGMKETKVTVRFVIIATILAGIALASLKVR